MYLCMTYLFFILADAYLYLNEIAKKLTLNGM